jgi:antitoxin ParD1/3/4
MSKNTSIMLGDHFEVFISKKVGSGRYHSASEVIREGLRLLEQEERKIEELRSALEHGEESGIAQDFNVTSHLKSLHSKHKEV